MSGRASWLLFVAFCCGRQPYVVSVVERPLESGDEKQSEAFWAWFAERGGEVHKNTVPALIGDGGLWGVKATTNIAKDEVLLRVPPSLILPLDLDAESFPGISSDVLHSIPDKLGGMKVAGLQLARLFDGTGDAAVIANFGPYLDKLKSLVFWHEIPEFVDALGQSPLRQEALNRHMWANQAAGPGSALNRSLYLHAYYSFISRAHVSFSEIGMALVPGGDMYNHDFRSNAKWSFSDSFLLVASRPIAEGEEILISYGKDKSNAEMFDYYGFTQAPYLEDFPTFELHLEESDGSVLPPGRELGANSRILHLAAPVIREGVGPSKAPPAFLEFAGKYNTSWRATLRKHIKYHLKRYNSDASLAPMMEMWRANRDDDPRTAVWWTPLPSCRDGYGKVADLKIERCKGERDLSSELSNGSFVSLCALRVKMSEYVCLTAFSEALQIMEGRRTWRTSLLLAGGWADSIKEGLEKRARYRSPPTGKASGPAPVVESQESLHDAKAVSFTAFSGAVCVLGLAGVYVLRHIACTWTKKTA